MESVMEPRLTAERRPIPGWEGRYEVDTEGNVYSLPRVVVRSNGWPLSVAGRILRAGIDSKGYPAVQLSAVDEGRERMARVHQLVALAFLGPPPPGHGVCHNDGDKTNSRLSNLRYATQLENMADRDAHGTTQRGARHAMAKLTPELVDQMRADQDAGMSQRAMTRKYRLGAATVWKVCHRKTWLDAPTTKRATQTPA